MDISTTVVKKLIEEQFPKWSNLEIKPVLKSGHDNRTFHLGDEMSIRLPSSKAYVAQVEKESKWLPIIAPKLELPITCPIAKGNPSNLYPYPWSINKWLKGETVNYDNVDLNQFAVDLATFLKDIQSIDSTGGPMAGDHNFFRGGDLSVYNDETQDALEKLKNVVDVEKCSLIWDRALSTKWTKSPVWVHGDVAQGNLLVDNGRLSAVIDFGILGVGDPACDLVMAWTFFDKESRMIFMEEVGLDEHTWDRARGWALWKALITYEDEVSKRVIKELLEE